MQRISILRFILAFVSAAVLGLPGSAATVNAASANQNRLDDDVVQRLQDTPESGLIPVIVEGAPDAAPAGPAGAQARARRAEDRVRSSGGRIVGSSALLGASIAQLSPAQVRAVAIDPAIGRVHFDQQVEAVSTAADGAASGTPIVFRQTIGATDAWNTGATGKGVTVAVLDTGIADNSAAFGSRVKARVDLVDPANPVQGDPAGHGSHVAGIVAASRSFESPGVAPDASLVSVRVLNEQGQARLSTVIAGLEWTIAHKSALDIDVAVMALGAPTHGSYRDDPLAAAAEMAWHSGIVLVVAAGNTGPTPGSISSPGNDPLVLTVGATDESGTANVDDDVIPAWSSQGPTVDGLLKPDLVAPGRKIVSVRVPGSTLDRLLPTHIEDASTFRLSGTSEATAVAGGAAALVLQQRGRLSPDELKGVLTDSTSRLTDTTRDAAGAGELNAFRALATPVPAHARQNARPADPLLHLLFELGRAVFDSDDADWDKVGWDKVAWDKVGWDKVAWDRVGWDRVGWD